MTLPNMWTGVMSYFGDFMTWDLMTGYVQAIVGISIAAFLFAKASQAMGH